MTENDFCNLNISLGHKIFKGGNYSWFVRSDKTAISIPSLVDIHPNYKDLNFLISNHKINSIFFKTDFFIKNASEYIYSGNNYDLSLFDSKTRNQIRKALKDCVFKRPSLVELFDNAFVINSQTLSSQKRSVKYLDDMSLWKDYIKCLYESNDVFILGAYHSDLLIAYSVFIKVLNKYYIYHPFLDRKYSSSSPMNGLLYTFINETIKRERSISISYGLSSIVDKSTLDKFKHGMLFVSTPCTRIVYFNNIYKFVFSKTVNIIVSYLNKLNLIPCSVYEKYTSLFNVWVVSKQYFLWRKSHITGNNVI